MAEEENLEVLSEPLLLVAVVTDMVTGHIIEAIQMTTWTAEGKNSNQNTAYERIWKR